MFSHLIQQITVQKLNFKKHIDDHVKRDHITAEKEGERIRQDTKKI